MLASWCAEYLGEVPSSSTPTWPTPVTAKQIVTSPIWKKITSVNPGIKAPIWSNRFYWNGSTNACISVNSSAQLVGKPVATGYNLLCVVEF